MELEAAQETWALHTSAQLPSGRSLFPLGSQSARRRNTGRVEHWWIEPTAPPSSTPPLSAWLPLWKWARERPTSPWPQRGGPRKPKGFQRTSGERHGAGTSEGVGGGQRRFLGPGWPWAPVVTATFSPAFAAGFCPGGCYRQRFRFELQLSWSVSTLFSDWLSSSKPALVKAQLSLPLL